MVTGASAGIGLAAARLFAREGAQLVVNARRGAELDDLVRQIVGDGGAAVAVPGRVQDEETAAALAEAALSRFGRLDIGFNNAGILGEAGPSSGVSAAGWRETLEVNLTGAFFGAKHQIPAMLRGGDGGLSITRT